MVSGAKGYVTKLWDTNELVKAIKFVAVGKNYISSDIAQKMASETTLEHENPFKCLTPREFEIFRLLANGSSVEEVSNILNIGNKTVANDQTQIKQKLDIHSSVEFASLAIKYDVIIKP